MTYCRPSVKHKAPKTFYIPSRGINNVFWNRIHHAFLFHNVHVNTTVIEAGVNGENVRVSLFMEYLKKAGSPHHSALKNNTQWLLRFSIECFIVHARNKQGQVSLMTLPFVKPKYLRVYAKGLLYLMR